VTDLREERLVFGGLDIAFDDRVLRPRPWTQEQARWAADLATRLPPGPVLELCCGAGQIGLAAVAGTDRSLVCVDLDPTAVEFTAKNAESAGLGRRTEVRRGRFQDVLRPHERFPLVIADPPWVESSETTRFPADPLLAMDGEALLQLGSVDQVAAALSVGPETLRCLEVRCFEGGVVARLAHSDEATRAPE
jgi:methylase of polypeptide subunit release factors